MADWTVTGEDRSKHDAQFYTLKPVNGFVTGTQARDFFVQSGLVTQVLGQIWTLADMNGDGKMDKKEFSIAMHLIKKKLQGYELPKALPASLKADPVPMMGTFAQPAMQQPMQMGFPIQQQGVPPMGMPMIPPQASLGTSTLTTGALNMGPRMANGGVPPGSPGGMPQGGSQWAIPHNGRLKHTQTFNAHDRLKRGYLLGVEARSILMQSGLPQQVLAQIWTLADMDKDGKLTCDEFTIAMHLSELARMGITLPPALPPEMVPAKTRGGSFTSPPAPAQQPGTPRKDAFTDLLGSAGMPAAVTPLPAQAPQVEEPQQQVSLEDKRKENFDKGHAELERRRALLREQQEKENNARLEKDRQEQEKLQRKRDEVEAKRQAELHRQLEKQREKERVIEAQRQQMLEQRESARRELERQRQLEWERQRKEQLIAEKQREYEQLSMLKTQMANLKNELESLDTKKAELGLKITQVQGGVTEFTSSIDGMRVARDRTMADIDLFDRQSMELNRKKSSLGSEKDAMSYQVQTAQATPLSAAHQTVVSSVATKRERIKALRQDANGLESDTEARLGEIDCNNAELRNMKEQIAKLERDLPLLKKKQDEKISLQKKAAQEMLQKQKFEKDKEDKLRTKAAPTSVAPAAEDFGGFADFNSSDAFGSVAAPTSSTSTWGDAFSSAGSSVPWGGTNGSVDANSRTKYKALYDFIATREDELSLVLGQEVWVLHETSPVSGMEDWLKGEDQGMQGWFPKAYVERMPQAEVGGGAPDTFASAFEPTVESSSNQKEQTDLFSSSQFSQPSAISDPPVTVVSPPAATSPPVNFDPPVDPATSETTQIPPEGLLAKATYPWKARQDSDLTFDKEDVIKVTDQQDMKYFGELNGKSGWFPKAYVKLIGVAPKPSESPPEIPSPTSRSPSPQTEPIAEPRAEPAPVPVEAHSAEPPSSDSPAPNGQGEYYIACYTYTSDEPSDLTFSEGDMVYVTQAQGDWWSGQVGEGGTQGMFPANYVKKLDIQPEHKSTESGNTGSLKKPEIARVIAPYVATGTGQLSLETGNLINVRQKSPRGWWEGELQVRGQKKKIGWFPANYVKLLGSGASARSTPEPTTTTGGLATASMSSRSVTPQSMTSQDGMGAPTNQQETVVSLYAYVAQVEDELTFDKDAVITVLSRDNPDWWRGQIGDQVGVFPSNYVTPNPASQS